MSARPAPVLLFAVYTSLALAQTQNPAPAPNADKSTAKISEQLSPTATPVASSNPASTSLESVDPNHVLLVTARDLYRRGDFQGAIVKYQALLQSHPSNPDAYAGMTRTYLKQKQPGLARSTVADGLTKSDDWRLHVALGEVLFREGKINEAEQEWVKVINSGHPDARAYLGLARVCNAIAMFKSAQMMVDKAHQLDPDDSDVQEAWVDTLSRSERIRYLESSLAGTNNWNADERQDLISYLNYLRESAKQPNRQCRLVSTVTHTETPLVRLLSDPKHLRGYGLTVSLNDHKSNLMLDTGAGGITVKRAIAEHAGISKMTETRLWGIGDKGKKRAYVGIVGSIRIGELEFQNCPIEIMDSRSVVEEDGLIGTDVFEDFLVDIDFPHEKVKLTELPKRPGEEVKSVGLKAREDDDSGDSESSKSSAADAGGVSKTTAPPTNSARLHDRYIAPEMQSYTRVYRFGHDILVPTRIGDAISKLFLLDTGALMNAISPTAAREVTKVHNDDTIVRGVSGSVNKVYSANKAVLQFGGLRQQNEDMIAFDTTSLSDAEGTEISGFLGFVMLHLLDVKIDYRDALVNFTYDAPR